MYPGNSGGGGFYPPDEVIAAQTSINREASPTVSGSGTTVLFTAAGAASDRDAAWSTGSVNLTPYAGQTVQILIETADASTASLVEAGVDNVTIKQS